MYHRPVVDISLDPAKPMPPLQPRPVRHLLDRPDADLAIDGGCRRAPGDIVDWPSGSYLDPGSDICEDCVRAAAEASTATPTR
jgi:hypothetical protein